MSSKILDIDIISETMYEASPWQRTYREELRETGWVFAYGIGASVSLEAV